MWGSTFADGSLSEMLQVLVSQLVGLRFVTPGFRLLQAQPDGLGGMSSRVGGAVAE